MDGVRAPPPSSLGGGFVDRNHQHSIGNPVNTRLSVRILQENHAFFAVILNGSTSPPPPQKKRALLSANPFLSAWQFLSQTGDCHFLEYMMVFWVQLGEGEECTVHSIYPHRLELTRPLHHLPSKTSERRLTVLYSLSLSLLSPV
jgi:hypothetical protein